jgi:hypothetical protein
MWISLVVQTRGANFVEKTDYLTCEHVMKGMGQPVLNHNTVGTKLHGLSPRANYTDRAAAAGRRS